MSKRLLHRDTVKGLHGSPAKSNKALPSDMDANPDSIVLTDAAWQEIRRQAKLEDSAPRAIRVGLRGGGCSGYTYAFEWDHKDPRTKDTVLSDPTGQSVAVYVDHRSLKLLKGTILDYHRSLMSSGFKFHNPNSSGTCGCGESTSF